MEGDSITGVTIMEMTKGLDQGKIYGYKEYKILDDDNNTSLFSKLAIIGKDLLLDLIEDIVNDKNIGIPQDDSKATYSKNIDASEEIIDLNNKSIDIINQIRGLSYTPGAYIKINDIKLKVYKAHIIEDNSTNVPGTILNIKKEIVIKTKDSAISLDLVQMPGKNMISGKDFSNGQKIFNINDVIKL